MKSTIDERDIQKFLKEIDIRLSILEIKYPYMSTAEALQTIRELDKKIKDKIFMLEKPKYLITIQKFNNLRKALRDLEKRSLAKREVPFK